MTHFRFRSSFEHGESARGPSDAVVRRRLSLWDTQSQKNATLVGLYRYWEGLRPTGLIPARADFDIRKLEPVMGMTWEVDVVSDDPLEFKVGLTSSALPLGLDDSRLCLRDIRCTPYRNMLATDYRAVKEIGTPAYHIVATRIDEVILSYARLVLPFAKDGRRITELYVCIVNLRFSDLVKALGDHSDIC